MKKGSILTPSLTVTPKTKIFRTRELPLKGEIICCVGDKVFATDIVGRASIPGDLHILRIPEKLGLTTEEVVQNLLVREQDFVQAGQIIYKYSKFFGLFRGDFKAPVDGTIELINRQNGHIGLRGKSTEVDMDAYVSGTVYSINIEKSVIIETECALVQGIFGVGGEKKGKICMLKVGRDQTVEKQDIPHEASALVLVGGATFSAEALDLAVKRGATGVITGAIDDKKLTNFLGYEIGIALTGNEDIQTTLILTEGFGKLTMSQRVFDVLSSFDGKPCSINGATQVRAGAVRPEIIVTLPKRNIHEEEDDILRLPEGVLDIGRQIRIIREPYFGRSAEVVEMPVELVKIETGAMTRVLKAKLEGGEVVVVPRSNVEIV